MVKFILGLIFVGVLASTFMSKFGGTPSGADKPAPSQPVPTQLATGAQRDEIVSRLVKGLEHERDKIEKVSFYSAKSKNFNASKVEAYIGLADGKLPYLRMKTKYFGDDWVFFNSIKIMADDAVIYGSDFGRLDISRNNSSGSVWEIADFIANDVEVGALDAIAKSKSSTIRFSGTDHRHDHEITKKERRDIQRVLEVYAQLSDQLKIK